MEINNPLKSHVNPHLKTSLVRSLVTSFLFMVLLITMAGCVTFNDPEVSQEYNSDPIGILDSHTTIGQTFIARRPNSNGITLWLTTQSSQDDSPTTDSQNSIVIKLYHLPTDDTPIFTTSILVPPPEVNTPITIHIPDQTRSAGESYYLELTSLSASIQVNGRNEDAYPHGQVFINDQPEDADIAFRLSYDYTFNAVVQDISQGVTYTWLVIPLLIALWLPGWLLLEISGLRTRFDFGEQTALCMGISLALIPIIMLWTTILNIKWTKNSVIFVAGFLVALLVVRLIYKYIILRRPANKNEADQSKEHLPDSLFQINFRSGISLALIMIFLFTLAIRLIMVRDLATPAWVDSVHHALITRLILSNGAYPASYLPYWNISPTAYHPGFHSIVAVFSWLSNLNVAQALLVLGQVLNALLVFSVYLITKTLTHSPASGLFAAVITGFLTPMPAYYTSWGRYTELTGLIILPVAFVLIQSLKNKITSRQRYWNILSGAIVSGGLFMVHYRVIIFLGCLILSYLVIYMLSKKSEGSIKPARLWLMTFIVADASMISVSPWLYQTIKNTVLPIIISSGTITVPFFQDFSWAFLTAALGKQTLVLAGLGLVWGMIRLRSFAFLLTFWILILFLMANLAALHLPGGGLINNTSVEIMLFIPISILGGYFLDQIIMHWRGFIPDKLSLPIAGSIIVLIGLVAIIGARQLVTIINPITILSRNADLPAIEWINENIPANETIVINPFAWGYGLYAGNDGGNWISPLTGRTTLPPPVLYGLGSCNRQIKEQSRKVIDLGSNPAALAEFLKFNQLHYIYVGAKGGVLSAEKLSASDLFAIRYQNDGVWIFSLKP